MGRRVRRGKLAVLQPPSLLQSGAGAVYHSGSDCARGGWNLHLYPLSPLVEIDPLGLVSFNLYPMRMHRDRILHLVSDLVDISGVYTVVRNGSFASRLAKKLRTKVIAEDTHWEVGVSQNNNKNSGILDITLGAYALLQPILYHEIWRKVAIYQMAFGLLGNIWSIRRGYVFC